MSSDPSSRRTAEQDVARIALRLVLAIAETQSPLVFLAARLRGLVY